MAPVNGGVRQDETPTSSNQWLHDYAPWKKHHMSNTYDPHPSIPLGFLPNLKHLTCWWVYEQKAEWKNQSLSPWLLWLFSIQIYSQHEKQKRNHHILNSYGWMPMDRPKSLGRSTVSRPHPSTTLFDSGIFYVCIRLSVFWPTNSVIFDKSLNWRGKWYSLLLVNRGVVKFACIVDFWDGEKLRGNVRRVTGVKPEEDVRSVWWPLGIRSYNM